MNRRHLSSVAWTILAAALCGGTGIAHAQGTYPERTIRIVVPFAAGGSTDAHARLLANRMTPLLGRSVIVEAKPGASGIIGTSEVVHARPDGYTLLLATSSTLIIAPAAVKTPPYNAMKDLNTIAIIGVQPIMIVATPSLPAKNLQELIGLLKANPGKYNYALSGGLTVNTLMMEMFKKQAGNLDVTAVPYKGTNEVALALVGGHVELAALTPGSGMELYRANKIRVLAVASESRLKAAPDFPTTVEQGLPDLVVLTFDAISIPAATPKPITDRLTQVIGRIMATDAYLEELDRLGMEAFAGSTSPERVNQFLNGLINRWSPTIKELSAREGAQL